MLAFQSAYTCALELARGCSGLCLDLVCGTSCNCRVQPQLHACGLRTWGRRFKVLLGGVRACMVGRRVVPWQQTRAGGGHLSSGARGFDRLCAGTGGQRSRPHCAQAAARVGGGFSGCRVVAWVPGFSQHWVPGHEREGGGSGGSVVCRCLRGGVRSMGPPARLDVVRRTGPPASGFMCVLFMCERAGRGLTSGCVGEDVGDRRLRLGASG